MKIKVNGFFRILDPLFAITVLCGITAIIVGGLRIGGTIWEAIGVTAIVLFVTWLLCFIANPKQLQFDDDLIVYNRFIRRSVKHGVSRNLYTKAKCTVTNIHNLRIRQTKIEKLFNVGRVSFSGETIAKVKEKYQDRIRNVPTKHSFSGVQNFEEVKKRLLEMSKDIQL